MGRNVDLSYFILDSTTGTLDPAFQAHVLPLVYWAMAVFLSWAEHEYLGQVFAGIWEDIAGKPRMWSMVRGPTAAVMASAWRIG